MTHVVRIVDNDRTDSNEDPDLVRVVEPAGLFLLPLNAVGLTNQQQVELLRAELRAALPLIDGEISMMKLSPGTNIGKLHDFLRAALDLKVDEDVEEDD